MARIRTIKPEFWKDEKLARLSRDARLLFIGLWNISDDHGILRGDPRYVRAEVFPYDEDLNVDSLLAALAKEGSIVRYSRNGERLIWIRNFSKHQVINRPGKWSTLPPPDDNEMSHGVLSEHSVSPHGALPSGMEWNGMEWNGMELQEKTKSTAPAVAVASPETFTDTRPGLTYEPDEAPPPEAVPIAHGKRLRKAKTPPEPDSLGALTEELSAIYRAKRGVAYKHSGAQDMIALKSLVALTKDPKLILKTWPAALDRTEWPRIHTIAQMAKWWNELQAPPAMGKRDPPGNGTKTRFLTGAALTALYPETFSSGEPK